MVSAKLFEMNFHQHEASASKFVNLSNAGVAWRNYLGKAINGAEDAG